MDSEGRQADVLHGKITGVEIYALCTQISPLILSLITLKAGVVINTPTCRHILYPESESCFESMEHPQPLSNTADGRKGAKP